MQLQRPFFFSSFNLKPARKPSMDVKAHTACILGAMRRFVSKSWLLHMQLDCKRARIVGILRRQRFAPVSLLINSDHITPTCQVLQ